MNKKVILLTVFLAIAFLLSLTLFLYYNWTSRKSIQANNNFNNENSVSKEVYKSAVLGVEDRPSLKLMAVGDIMLGRTVGKRLNGEFNSAFSEVKSYLQQADILFGNLESPISDRGTRIKGKGITFSAHPTAVKSLTYAGFDVVSLANNHILDFNTPSLLQTIQLLDNEKILHCGAGKDLNSARKPVIIDHYGLKVAFLAYTDMYNIYYSNNKFTFEARDDKAGVAPRKLDYIIEDIHAIRKDVDIIVVSLHWGIEESFEVSDKMVDFAHTLIDSGADVILGHHPHQLQGIEIYKKKPIAYSLGNFIFDQNDDENKESMILELDYKDKELLSLKAVPLRIIDKMKVVPAPLGKREIIQNRLVQLSKVLGTKAYNDGEVVIFEIAEKR